MIKKSAVKEIVTQKSLVMFFLFPMTNSHMWNYPIKEDNFKYSLLSIYIAIAFQRTYTNLYLYYHCLKTSFSLVS